MGLQSKLKNDIHRSHRKQSLWQIYVPLGLAVLAFAGVAVLIALPSNFGSGQIERWAAVSTIWIVAPLMVILLVLIAVSGGFIFLQAKIYKNLPGAIQKALGIMLIIRDKVAQATDKSVFPIVKVNSWRAGWAAFWKHFRR